MMHRNSRIGRVAALAALTSCAASHPVDLTARPTLDGRAVVEFEAQGNRVQLDSVMFTRDSITGFPWHDPSRCCGRLGYALAEISPPQIKQFPPLGGILAIAVGALLIVGFETAIHAGGG